MCPTAVRPEPAGSGTRTQSAWTIAMGNEPDGLVRVLTLLRRRRCEILGVDYEAGGRGRQPRLRVRVRSLGGRPGSLEPWLRGVVGVREVTREP